LRKPDQNREGLLVVARAGWEIERKQIRKEKTEEGREIREED